MALWLSSAQLLGFSKARAWTAPVPDIVLYCTPAMTGPLGQVAQLYTAASHTEVHIFTAPPDGILGLLKHRARDDVVVADQATVQALAEDKIVSRETVMQLGKNPFVLIGNTGNAQWPDASADQLVAARQTVLPDPTTAASFDGAALLRAAMPAVRPVRLIGVADTPTVIQTVRNNSTLIGLVSQTESHDPGLRSLAVLAVPPSTVSVALVANGQSANAPSFVAFLAGPLAKATFRSAGLEAP